MDSQQNLEKALNQLELSIKEKQVYTLILQHGKIAPALIARKTGIQRTTVYSVASELKNRGLIIEDLGSKTLYYLPAPETELEKVIQKDQEKLEKKKEGLQQLQETLKFFSDPKTFSIPKIRFIAEEDLEKYLYDATPRWIESNLANDPTWWGYQDHTFAERYKEWIVWFWKKAPLEIALKLFSNDKPIESEMWSEEMSRREIRFWDGTNDFTGTMWIVGSYVIMVVTSQKPYYLVEIHDSVMAHNMREVFRKLWNK